MKLRSFSVVMVIVIFLILQGGSVSATPETITLLKGYAAEWVVEPPEHTVLYQMVYRPSTGDIFISAGTEFIQVHDNQDGTFSTSEVPNPDATTLFTGVFTSDGTLYANGHDLGGVLYKTTDLSEWTLVANLDFSEGNWGYTSACGDTVYFSQGSYANRVVYKLEEDGSYTSFATIGNNDFMKISGMQCDDASGTLYVSNWMGIYSVTASGVVSSVWSLHWTYMMQYYIDSFDLSPDGAFYVALSNYDWNSGKLLKVQDNNATEVADFDGCIWDISVRSNGDIWVLDYFHNRLYLVSAVDGSKTTVIKGSELQTPGALSFDTAGNLYVANIERMDISKIESNGSVTQYGSGFNLFYGSAIDTDIYFGPDGRLYVAEGDPLVEMPDQLSYVSEDGSPAVVSSLDGANGLAVKKDGTVYVSSGTLGQVWKWSGKDGDNLTLFADNLTYSRSLLLDPSETKLFVTAHKSNEITVLDASTGVIIDTLKGPQNVSYLRSMVYGADGYLYVIGDMAIYRSQNGTGDLMLFADNLDTPADLAFDVSGDLYYCQGISSDYGGVARITGFPSATLAVTVQSDGGTPLPDAQVQVLDSNKTALGTIEKTGANGMVTFQLAPSTYSIGLVAGGDFTSATLAEGESKSIIIEEPSGKTISLISPQDKKSLSFGSVNGQINFSFGADANAEAYLLNLTLYDMLNDYSLPIQIPLVPPTQGGTWGGGTTETPGFTVSALGICSYTIPLDAVTWDSMALYDISWSISALSDANDSSSVMGTSDIWSCKLQPAQSVTLISPANGASLDKKTDSAPQFTWELYQGAGSYYLILAHVGSLGFDSALEYPGQTLNLFPMDDSTWQMMPTGTWYWTVIAVDGTGGWLTPNFTIFSFEVL